MSTLALVHSPLTGPFVWQPAMQDLARRGVGAVIPEVADHPSATGSFWEQESASAARSLRGIDGPIVLVAHSGGGALLPAIRERTGGVAGYLFVDAVIPRDSTSRLDLIREEAPEWAEELEGHLSSGERFPTWTDEDLQEVVPERGLRRGLIEELRPRPLAFFTEPISVFAEWPDAPCGYLRLSRPYDPLLEDATRRGWSVAAIEAGHFHMLVDPPAVVDAMLGLLEAMSITPS
jgi:pimeloyl-ACP methyl ester carboxylesterase